MIGRHKSDTDDLYSRIRLLVITRKEKSKNEADRYKRGNK